MLKTELVAKVAENAGLSKTQADAAINALVETITEALVSGDKISLKGFGTVVTGTLLGGKIKKDQEAFLYRCL